MGRKQLSIGNHNQLVEVAQGLAMLRNDPITAVDLMVSKSHCPMIQYFLVLMDGRSDHELGYEPESGNLGYVRSAR